MKLSRSEPEDSNPQAAFPSESIKRLEDHRFVTGDGRYVADLPIDELLWARFVRSAEAHGELRAVDLGRALEMPGVVAVLQSADIGDQFWPTDATLPDVDRPLLAKDRVRFVGEAAAVVIAESEAMAADAASELWLDIEPIEAVIDLEEAIKDATLVHPHLGSNVVELSQKGEISESSDSELVVTSVIRNQRLSAVPLEPLSTIAEPTGGGIRLWAGSQAPHTLAGVLSKMLDVDVDVVVPDVGGGFGQKIHFTPEYGVLALAAMRLGRPVGWIQTRRESLSASPHGRDMIYTVTLHGDRSGRVRRADFRIDSATGAYPHTGARVSRFAERVAIGVYDIVDARVERRVVLTNTTPTAPYRGAGRPEAAYAIERAIDDYARAGGLDPVEVRRCNMIEKGSLPYRTSTGVEYDSGDYPKALDMALDLIGIDRWRKEQSARLQSGKDLIGIGVGAFIESAGGPSDSGEYGRVALSIVDDELMIEVHTGSVSHGQGHATVWAQLVASIFGVSTDRAVIVAGDTRRVADGWGTLGSRSAQTGASAVWKTANVVLTNLRSHVAAGLEAHPEDLVFQDGLVAVKGAPASARPIGEVVSEALTDGVDLTAEEFFVPGVQTYPYGVHCAVVEVSRETGEVRVVQLVAVDDCGNVLNPMIVRGQVDGSIAQGYGQALHERVVYDEAGQLLTSTLMDYGIPRATDMFPVTHGRLYSPAPSNPLGVKGTGEAGCIGTPPAIVNAAIDALAPLGVMELDMPLTPANVWTAIQRSS